MALVRSCACLKRQPFAFWTQRRKFSQELVVLSDEVSTALRQGEPVVALESTIITHGMPYPKNLSTATDVEATVRSRGAIPATVGVYQGRLHVGMGSQLLEELAKLGDKAAKISRRDLPAALSKGLSGGTTVSSTMVACNRAGIQVFVTGGIGGVHRGGESTLDISADLSELGRTPVAVISAGVKSILDIGRTLEFLETEGVCVAAFGDSQDFPSFFTSRSGHHAPWRVANASDAAAMIASRNALHLDSGILIAVPIPKEFEADGESVERAIELAAQEAKDAGITGNAVTPYILNRVNEVTGGASLRSNVALIKNNAVVGSDVAVALAELERKSKRANFFKVASSPAATGQPVVVGGSVVDLVVGVNERIQMNGQTHGGRIRTSFGGVARNVADCMTRLSGDASVRLVSAVGWDRHGDALLAHNPAMDMSGVERTRHAATATYCTVLDQNGDCVFGVGDMAIHEEIDVKQIQRNERHILSAPMVILDGNLSVDTISYTLGMCHDRKIPVWYETTDIRKAVKPFLSDSWQGLAGISPNLAELRAICQVVAPSPDAESFLTSRAKEDPIQESIRLAMALVPHIRVILVTLGPLGALLMEHSPSHQSTSQVNIVHYPARKHASVTSVSGAGDCLTGAMLCGMLRGLSWDHCLAAGLEAAQLSLASSDTVPATLGPDCFSARIPMRPRRVSLP